MIHTPYDFGLLLGSILVGFLVCYLAVSIQFVLFSGLARKYEKIFLVMNGLILSGVIGGLHFISRLGYPLPVKPSVDSPWMWLSYFMAFMAATFALWLTTRPHVPVLGQVFGALLMGCGLFVMQYFGIHSLVIFSDQIYSNRLLTMLALSIAIIGSALILGWVFYYKNSINKPWYIQFFVSLMMVLTIIGMHYTSISAISFNVAHHHLVPYIHMGNKTILWGVLSIVALGGLTILSLMLLEQCLKLRNIQLSKAHHDLADQALQDQLTQLPNRLFLARYSVSLFSEHKQNQSKIAFLYLDLDRFKAVNEVFGHDLGDQLLIQLASRIQSQLAEKEKLLRIGNDEFLMVLENSTTENAIEKAEHILKLIQQDFFIADKVIHISSSIGIALYPDHGHNLQDLLTHADAAMEVSKYQGRNTYSVFNNTPDQQQGKNQIKLFNDLYKAVEEQQFILFYQPKFTTHSHEICGVEALIRWNHPHLGHLTPNMFIEEAEKTGLIIQMGYWALEQACKQIKIWEECHFNYFPIAVNLSAVQFAHKHLFSTLEGLFQKYQINPSHLGIEITESTAMQDIAASIRSLERLRQMGIQLAIDDFGTGYSSFLYLKDLPVDELKIDRAFICHLAPGSKEEMILDSIIHLAIKLGLVVTAEGVETQLQADILTRLDCQQVQGYLLGKPMDVQHLNQMNYTLPA